MINDFVYPHAEELAKVTAEILALDTRRNELGVKISRYEAFSPAQAKGYIQELQTRDAHDEQRQRQLSADLVRLTDAIGEAEAKQTNWFNLLAWFDTAQQELGKEVKRLRNETGKIKSELTAIDTQTEQRRIEISRTLAELSEHAQTPILVLREEKAAVSVRLSQASADQETLNLHRQQFDAELSPVKQDLRAVEQDLQAAQRKAELARRYDADLGRASSGKRKWEIHALCERDLGTGKPRRALEQLNPKIEALERSREKLRKRARELSSRWSRKIEAVIIDGSNVCYNTSSEFVGLLPLKAMLPVIATRYDAKLVFDASIRRKLRANDAEIRRSLETPIELIVMPTKTKADETIVTLANGSPSLFIISNDAFREFADYEAVASGRLLRHVIDKSRVLIHDLGVNAEYNRNA